MSEDTTMRDGRPEAHPEQDAAGPTIERLFTPAELDLEDLAEAIGLLLTDDHDSRITASKSRDFDLLSRPDRGTHVCLEASKEP